MSSFEELAERCEQATGPDRELDAAIFNAASEQMERWNRTAIQLPLENRRSRYDDGWVHVYAGKGLNDKYPEDLPAYSRSLDAAMTLVPEMSLAGLKGLWDGESKQAFRGSVDTYEWIDGLFFKENFLSLAATPALALCAAVLRARAASVDTHRMAETGTGSGRSLSGTAAVGGTPVTQSDIELAENIRSQAMTNGIEP